MAEKNAELHEALTRVNEPINDALRISEVRLRLAAEAAQMGTWDLDLHTGDLSWSPIEEKLMGFEPGTFRGKAEAFLGLLHPDSEKAYVQAQERVRNGDGMFQAELRFRLPDGRERWGLVSGKLLLDEQGKPSRLVGVDIDITRRKIAEEQFRSLNAELENRVRERTIQLEIANQELESFSYSVSHDLRAPLRGIDGWSFALLEDCGDQLDERGRQHLSRVRGEARRMGLLIDDLLELSRVTRLEMELREVELSALAETVVRRLREGEPKRSAEFIIQLGLSVHGDPRLLEIALTNLFGNAFKFSSGNPKARIEFGQSNAVAPATFFVKDNGVGFDMAYASKLFGAFQRLHHASEFPGTGIGLATVHRILHRHGGRIWAEARLGEGATFYFSVSGNP